jgi:hypothetical protein
MEGSYFLVLKTITFFRLSKNQELLEERDGWMRVTNQLGSHQYLDPCMPKGAPEVLLSGSAYSPGGVPLNNLSINLRVESFEKGLEVFGNRIWQKKNGWDINKQSLLSFRRCHCRGRKVTVLAKVAIIPMG